MRGSWVLEPLAATGLVTDGGLMVKGSPLLGRLGLLCGAHVWQQQQRPQQGRRWVQEKGRGAAPEAEATGGGVVSCRVWGAGWGSQGVSLCVSQGHGEIGVLGAGPGGGHAGEAEGKVGCCLNRCRLGPRAVAGTTLTCRCPEGPRPQLSSPPSGGPRRPGSCGQGRPREQTPRRPGLSPGPLQQGPDLCPQGQDASRGWPVTGPSHCPPRRKGTRSQSGGAHRARVMVPSTLGLPTPAEGPPGAYLGGEGPPRQLARSQTAGR